MSRPTSLSATPLAPRPAEAAPAASSADRQRLAQMASEFESMLVLEMIKTMRQSMLEEGAEGEGLGADTFSSTIDNELARHLSGSGGLGLQQMMLEAWDRQQQGSPVAPATTSRAFAVSGLEGTVPSDLRPSPRVARTATASVARPGSASAAAAADVPPAGAHDQHAEHGDDLGLEISGRVSSAYGWRRDPFTGGSRFHGGIDLAARYGTDVPVAADGVVVAAGEHGAYGLTVVVRHGDGYQTRYAHLSSIDVQEGATVDKGTRVGRVGSTGRSTAPHLHFEVLKGGQRIDPDRFVKNLASDIKGQ